MYRRSSFHPKAAASMVLGHLRKIYVHKNAIGTDFRAFFASKHIINDLERHTKKPSVIKSLASTCDQRQLKEIGHIICYNSTVFARKNCSKDN